MKSLLVKIKDKYQIDLNERDNEIELLTVGKDKKFTVSYSHGEYTVYSDKWHEHFEDLEELEKFIDGLLAGNIQIAIKYRGQTPVGHQVQIIKDRKKHVISQTGSLFSAFWKKNSIEYINYSTANKTINPTGR